ncbi:MAG: cytochrome C oxidase subunit IV family protein [Candidatus Thioglobus sp.]|nr:cytochrome C oxidase subunit IV family protein [Candidatus Thioglobus pontius]MBL6977260.1 cytochrome C oxidase subunit IV family protein [Candidatus Thioglobus sp.]MBL6984160.1 cytochrome C oxidase subunit IV family protein [Candidatus Thioglobus sp.]
MNANKSTIWVTIIYTLLVILTLVTYQIGESGLRSLDISLMVFAIAIAKGALISEYFMQLHWVKGIWRLPILIWLLLLSITIYIAFTA